ncbi:type II toxin-antitoxin system prevent-host-death family antitoxin [Pantoea sp. ICBG 1758]|uniref:type II toxin-antitoxin system prevent-host-death family antitoxin n=1 Tax=Pantoea sp. ICBG 1758 TaxID=2071682 RepID=UPI001304A852|nr:type II toxin-antitoxin system prevent-host-death family antitoxin [Pantoea sp. ICBG 1758]
MQMSSAEARQNMAEIMNGTEDVVLTQRGKPLKAVISFEDYEAFKRLKIEQELSFIFERHGDVIEALSDR